MNVFCPHCGSEFAVTFLTTDSANQLRSNVANAELNARSNGKNARSNAFKGGLGVGLDPVISDLDPSDPSQQSGSGARAIRRGRKDVADYPVAFQALWALAKAQGKAGNKYPAFKSYLKLNADDELNALILKRFEEWTKADAWKRGFNQHLSTWLNQRGWEEPPTPADLRGAETKNVAPGASYCAWHQSPMNNGRASNFPKDTCPECRHVKAMNGTRVSDVYQEDPMVTDIKRRRGLL